MAARAGPWQGGRARRDARPRKARWRFRPTTARTPSPSSNCVPRPTSGPRALILSTWPTSLAALVASDGEDAVDQRKAAIEDLNIVPQGKCPTGRDRALRGRPRQCARLVLARPERPRRQRCHRRVEGRHLRSWPTTSPSTSPSAGPSTCAVRTYRPKRSRPSGPLWRPRAAGKASPKRLSPRSSRASSRVGSSACRVACCWNSPTPRTISRRWPRHWVRRRSCGSPR